MKFSVAQIKRNASNEPFAFDDHVDVSELESMNNDIRKIGSVHVSGTVMDQGDDIFFTFAIDGTMVLPCARTLVDVPYPFEISAAEVFTESPYEADDSDDDIHPIDGELLDLTPLIKENILLEVPYRVYSDDADAVGQAPLQGDGWELVSEDTKEQKPDPRLKKLESLLEDKEEKE
ncbi:YceD family protein [Lentibacillus jeotgali]|uniref:YceD family protein n=1 Tax=Lentibacillus jeotgali TaxID=558169 RepID=UPI0002626832|nr:YceD family protein [Lentibacillus jeotgali]